MTDPERGTASGRPRRAGLLYRTPTRYARLNHKAVSPR